MLLIVGGFMLLLSVLVWATVPCLAIIEGRKGAKLPDQVYEGLPGRSHWRLLRAWTVAQRVNKTLARLWHMLA